MLRGLVLSALVIVALIVAIAGIVIARHRRRDQLKRRFRAEYDRVIQEHGDNRLAEAVLRRRVRRVKRFRLRSLTPADQEAYWAEWAAVQRRFVDDPWLAVGLADHLIIRVMTHRGYPLSDVEQRMADISVTHPDIVQSYRAAHAIVWRHENRDSRTEDDLRMVMDIYRSLFDALLTPNEQLHLQAIDAGGTGVDHKHAS